MNLLINIAIIIISIISIIFIYNYFNSNKSQLSNLKSGTKSISIPTSKLVGNKSTSNYAYSIWFYVKNWEYRLTESKELLSRTPKSLNNNHNP